jgi:Zn-dependent M28 family amino/carboxypeptidase
LGGGSDHASFAAVGIPAGGLFSGAGSVKTAQQAAVYGGIEGQALDPCYHRECDRVEGINWEVLGQFAAAAAHTVLTYAMDDLRTMSRPPSGAVDGVLEGLDYRGPVMQR